MGDLLGTCRGCGASIRWVRMAKSGKSNPLNPEPDQERGNIAHDATTGEGYALGKVQLETFRAEGAPLYLSHFATCPKRQRFRKDKPA